MVHKECFHCYTVSPEDFECTTNKTMWHPFIKMEIFSRIIEALQTEDTHPVGVKNKISLFNVLTVSIGHKSGPLQIIASELFVVLLLLVVSSWDPAIRHSFVSCVGDSFLARVSEAEHVAEMSLVVPDRGHPGLFSDVTDCMWSQTLTSLFFWFYKWLLSDLARFMESLCMCHLQRHQATLRIIIGFFLLHILVNDINIQTFTRCLVVLNKGYL